MVHCCVTKDGHRTCMRGITAAQLSRPNRPAKTKKKRKARDVTGACPQNPTHKHSSRVLRLRPSLRPSSTHHTTCALPTRYFGHPTCGARGNGNTAFYMHVCRVAPPHHPYMYPPYSRHPPLQATSSPTISRASLYHPPPANSAAGTTHSLQHHPEVPLPGCPCALHLLPRYRQRPPAP